MKMAFSPLSIKENVGDAIDSAQQGAPFLDLRIIRGEKMMPFGIYGKAIHTQGNILESSKHSHPHKMAPFHALIHRLFSEFTVHKNF